MKDPDCIFCKIAAGELFSHRVYEDEDFIAFLDIHPQAPGHVQVIPKEHYRWVWDLPPEKVRHYFQVVQKIALAEKKAFNTELIRSQVYGDEVPHAHIWVWPNDKKVGKLDDFEGNAKKIKEAI